ncbi:hypothetical protein D3C76_1426110 [compost metagenome]
MCKRDFADYALGQVDHFLISHTVTGSTSRFFSLKQGQGLLHGLSEIRIFFIEPYLVEKQLSAQHVGHFASVIGNRIEQVQRIQLLDWGVIVAGALVEFFEKCLL